MATLEDLLREISQTPIPEEMGQEAQETFQEGDVGGGGLFGQYSITDPFSISMLQDAARAGALSNYLGQFEGRTPLDIIEIDAPDQRGEPTELGDVENIFEILSQIMTGTQGTIGGLAPETVAALRSGIDPSADEEELETIAQQILEAGGYLEWLEQQDQEGPPEELPTELEEEIDIGTDTIDTDVEVDPDMPIYIPFPDLPPREEGDEGEGDENGEGTGVEGEGDEAEGEGRGQDRGDGEEPTRGGGRGGGSIGDDPVGRSEEDPFRIILSTSTSGSSGSNGGTGDTGQPTGMFKPTFDPFFASINYAPVAVPKLVLPEAPVVSSLFSEYLT